MSPSDRAQRSALRGPPPALDVLVGQAQRRPIIAFAVDRLGAPLAPVNADGMQAAMAGGLDAAELMVRPDVQEAIDRALAGESVPLTIRLGAAQIEGAIEPLRDQAGRIEAVIAIGYETSEYRVAIDAIRDREERLRTILDTILDGIIVIDERGIIESFNKSASRIFGYSAGELIGRGIARLMPEPEASQHDGYLARYLASGEAHILGLSRKVTARRKDSSLFTMELAVSEMRVGARRKFIASVRDLTERERWQEALRMSEERYNLLAEGANDGLWEWDIVHGTAYFSPRWLAILGLGPNDGGRSVNFWHERVHSDDLPRVRAALDAYLDGSGERLDCEHRVRSADGSWRWVLARGLAVRDGAGRALRLAGSLSDLTEKKRAEEMVEFHALHDTLTGLPNRALLLDRIERSLVRRRGHGEATPFAVMSLNLDRFKVLNDSLGHAAGNAIITAIAQRLEAVLPEDETVAHLGGDEFAVLLGECVAARAVDLAERVLAAIRDPLDIDGRRLALKASLGIRLHEGAEGYAADILRDAGLAMFSAKSEGGNQARWFEASMREQSATLLGIETEIREALEEGRLCTFYQPIVDLASGKLVGFEALARIVTRTGRLLSPGEFIPIAEQAGLITALGMTILEQSCEQGAVWRRLRPDLTVAVNLSAKQFDQSDLVERVAQVMRRTGMLEGLKLEVTEGALIGNPDLATEKLIQLKALGAKIALDDFGTGYSSLSYLDRFPIDILKIDRSFVIKMTTRQRHRDLVHGIVALAHTLDMKIIAEGIEYEAQSEALRQMGCEMGQGYIFGRPMPAEQAHALVVAAAAAGKAEGGAEGGSA